MSRLSRANTFNTLAIVATCVTGALHWVGVYDSLYWTYQLVWDIPTHIAAGLMIGFWAAAVCTKLGIQGRRAFLFIVGLTVAVGVAWEIWELLEGLTGGYGGPLFDACKDVVDDTIGALFVWFVYRSSYRKSRKTVLD